MRRFLVASLLTGGLALTVPLSASAAPTAAITRASTEPTWTRAHIAGTIACLDCAGSLTFSKWTPIVTVQPSLPEYYCRGDEWADSDPNTRVIWGGPQQTGNATIPFDVPDALIMAGVYGQRVCALVVHVSRYREPICVAQAPILGLDPNVACPLEDHIFDMPLTSSLLTVETPQTPAQEPAVPSIPPAGANLPDGPASELPARLSSNRARAAATSALRRKLGRRWTRGARKRFSYSRASSVKIVCRVRWRYRSRGESRRVTVTLDGAAIRTTVRR